MHEYEIGKIKNIRKQLNLTQKQLANLSGVSQSLIAKIESGDIDPAYSKVVQIVAALNAEQNKSKKKVAQIMTSRVLFVSPSDNVAVAMKTMRFHNISQLPVLKDGACIGSISEGVLVDLLSSGKPDLGTVKVHEVMGETYPVVPFDSPIEIVIGLLKHYSAVLVNANGKVSGIVTKADLFKAV